ncbi:hypothetical protein Tco_0117087, partial [Tanacetum coccineum]
DWGVLAIMSIQLDLPYWKRISDKRTKIEAKNDKTKHEIEERKKSKSKSTVKSTDIKEMDKIKAKTDKTGHEKERVHKSWKFASKNANQDGKPITCCGCEGPLKGGFCSFCASRDGNSFAYDLKPNSSDYCCYECGDSLDDIFCQRCTCKSCGKGAHYGYNCPPQIPIISNPEPCYNQNLNEILQNLQSLQQQCLLGTCQQCGCNEYDGVCFYCTVGNGTPINFSTPYSSNDSPNFANHPPQPQYVLYSCELCGNDAHHGYDCPPQVPFVYNQDPCSNQNFDYFPQTSPSFPQQCLCCENCGGPHATFQCQPMNEDYYHEQNSCYDSNSFGFDQFQPPQFPVNYPPQETSKEILQAREDLMEAIQAFLKEYDHIPPNEKCMALLLAEERFLKIKQTMEEEQNQPGVMQELLLKLMDDLQILKGSQQKKKETSAQSFTPYWNFSMIDDEEARDNFMKDICTFLRKFSRIPFGVTPKVLLVAWESFGKIKDALTDKHYQQEDIQELMSKLLEDVRNIREDLTEYINCPSWNRPTFYDNDDDEYTIIYSKPKAITPVLSIEEPDNSLSMGEHLDTIPSVEDLVPILSEFNGIFEDTCDVPVCEDPSIFYALSDHSEILSDSNNDGTSSDDDSYENIEYVEASPLNLEYDSLEEVNEDQEEKEFDLEDIFQIQDVILREKLVNISRLITNIQSLKDTPTPNHVFKSPFSFPIPVTDSDSFLEYDHTEETRSGSTTTHANNSLPEYDSFLFEVEPDQGGLINIIISDNSNDLLLELPEFESFHFDLYDDPSFPHPPPEPPDVETSLIVETDAPVIKNFDELNEDECFDPGGDEIDVEDDDSFTFVTQIKVEIVARLCDCLKCRFISLG